MSKSISYKYILVIMLIAAIVMTIYWYAAGDDMMTAASIGLSVICAALPLPYLGSQTVSRYRIRKIAAGYGVRLSSPEALPLLGDVDTLVLAHRSQLFANEPLISQIIPEGIGQNALLELAAATEQESSHPYARAIAAAIKNRHLRIPPATGNQEFPGAGVEAIVKRDPVYVGSRELVESEGVHLSADLLTRADQLATRGAVPVFIGRGSYGRGIIAFVDEPAPGIPAALSRLQQLGLRLILMTSADRRLAAYTARQLSLDEARHGLSPITKAREIQLLRAGGSTVAVLTTDERDAAASAEADIVVRMAAKSPAAADTPDPAADTGATGHDTPSVTLPAHSLYALTLLINLGRRLYQLQHQNRRLTIIVSLVTIPWAMGLLHAFGGPLLTPVPALLINLSLTLLTALNSLRLK